MTVVADWSVLELDGVMDLASNVSRRISNSDMPLLHKEDVENEALIILASRASEARERFAEGGLALLGTWLRYRLLDALRPEMRRMQRQDSYEDNRESVPEFESMDDRRTDRLKVGDLAELDRIDADDLAYRREVGVA